MNGRDANGRFTKGNQIAKGNKGGRPRRSTEERLLQRLVDNVSDGAFDAMIGAGLEKARDGDKAWAALLLAYLIGQPTQYIKQDVDGQGVLTIEYVNDWREHQAPESA